MSDDNLKAIKNYGDNYYIENHKDYIDQLRKTGNNNINPWQLLNMGKAETVDKFTSGLDGKQWQARDDWYEGAKKNALNDYYGKAASLFTGDALKVPGQMSSLPMPNPPMDYPQAEPVQQPKPIQDDLGPGWRLLMDKALHRKP